MIQTKVGRIGWTCTVVNHFFEQDIVKWPCV